MLLFIFGLLFKLLVLIGMFTVTVSLLTLLIYIFAAFGYTAGAVAFALIIIGAIKALLVMCNIEDQKRKA